MKENLDWHDQLSELSKKLNFAGADIMEEVDTEILNTTEICDTEQ